MLNLSIATENFEAKAGQLYSFPATPGKQCLRPKVSLGGLRDRTVEYTTWVLMSRNPRKAMFAPKSVSRGLRDRTVEYTT